jgi:precorrin-2 dehydrogenase/sirohydrochlorin ferrochelatase/precorrin-6A/cobalt-precorrin-6A reductase
LGLARTIKFPLSGGLPSDPAIKKFPFFPLFTDIAGRRVVLIGGGKVAARRAKTLLTCGARVTVISPSFDPAFDLPEFAGVERVTRPYHKSDLKDAALAVAAANDRSVNREVGLEAKDLSIPVSVADAPGECSFLFPSLVERDGFVAAVSTGGRYPSLCRRLADRLRGLWPDWVEEEIKKGKS